jgi:hypothetical protein
MLDKPDIIILGGQLGVGPDGKGFSASVPILDSPGRGC